jgi:hypothetical protein
MDRFEIHPQGVPMHKGLWLSIFALFISCNAFLLTVSHENKLAGDVVYELSTWSQDDIGGMTLNFYSFLPIGYCLMERNVEVEKACVIGADRYWRFNRPSEKSGGRFYFSKK